jgi:hypothetical protein
MYIECITGIELPPPPIHVLSHGPLTVRKTYCTALHEYMYDLIPRPWRPPVTYKLDMVAELNTIDPSACSVMTRVQLYAMDRVKHLCAPTPQAFSGKHGVIWTNHARFSVVMHCHECRHYPNKPYPSETKTSHRYAQLCVFGCTFGHHCARLPVGVTCRATA